MARIQHLSRSVALPRWSSLPRLALVDVCAIGFALAVSIVLIRVTVGASDYPQWLSVSNYFMGRDVPDYRNYTALPPAIPILLSLERLFIPDPVDALQCFQILLLLGLLSGFYLCALAFFQSRTAGFVAMVAAALLNDRFLELFAFGGLFQLGALVFSLLSIAFFVFAGRTGKSKGAYWLSGSVCLGLTILSHAGTATVVVPAILLVAGIAAWNLPGSLAERAGALKPVIVTFAIVGAYWVGFILPNNETLATNPASLSYRGPERLLVRLMVTPTLICMAVGLAYAVWLATRELLSLQFDKSVALLGWAGLVWGALAASILMGAGTDYPRFATVLLAPMIVMFGGAVDGIGAILQRRFTRQSPDLAVINVPLLIAGLLILFYARPMLNEYYQSANFYNVADLPALEGVARRLGDELPSDRSVLTARAKHGKWVEGLTGRASLFSMPVRYSFRTAEWERSIAADTLIKSTYAMTSPNFFLKYYGSESAGNFDVPQEPWIGANHDGEFIDFLRVNPRNVHVIGGGGALLSTLDSLHPTAFEPSEDEGGAQVVTGWAGERNGGPLTVKETTRLQANGTLQLSYDAVVPGVNGLNLTFSPVPQMTITEIRPLSPNAVEVVFPRYGSRQPVLRIESTTEGSRVYGTVEGVAVESPGGTATVVVEDLTAGAAFAALSLRNPHQLLEDYKIDAVVLEQDSALEARTFRLASLGLTRAYEVGPYVVFMRESLSREGD